MREDTIQSLASISHTESPGACYEVALFVSIPPICDSLIRHTVHCELAALCAARARSKQANQGHILFER